MKVFLKDIKKDVRELQPKERVEHVNSVAETAVKIGKHYGLDINRLEMAAWLHDYAKFFDSKYQEKIVKKFFPDNIDAPKPIWHCFTAYVIARDKMEINDQEILNSVLYHATGNEKLSDFEKIIFIADFCEPLRTYKEANEVYTLVFQDLEDAYLMALEYTSEFVIKKGFEPYKWTKNALKEFSK